MNKLYTYINNFFSSEYANKSAIVGNVLSLMLYKIAYPSARLFARISIKPDLITWLSFVFTGFAVFSLFRDNGPVYFVLFWLISLHLDFVDGTLARMTKKVSKSAFRLDHMTDLVKLFLVFISLGLFYNNLTTWILVCVTVFALMYSEILSHEIKHYLKRGTESKESKVEFSEAKIIDSKWLKVTGISNFKNFITLLRNINSIFFSISGHTLIFFCFLPFGEMYANSFLTYFSILCIYGIIRTVISLSSLRR